MSSSPAPPLSSLLLALIFALCFGTLVLYAGSFFGVSLVVIFITCTVIAAPRQDIKEYGQSRMILLFTIVLAVFVIFGTLSFGAALLGDSTFNLLAGLIMLFLLAYIVESRLRARRKGNFSSA